MSHYWKSKVLGLLALCLGCCWPCLASTPQEVAETVQRALADLASDDVETRAGAVMLLGKYRDRVGRQAVIEALEDEAVRVRRAAAVTVAEWSHEMPPEASVPMLRLLADDDVEVRREVAGALNILVSYWKLFQRMPGGREVHTPQLEGILQQAFADEDALVRQSMVENYRVMGIALPPPRWQALVNDPVPEVRRAALPLAALVLPNEEVARIATDWAQREDAVERLLAVQAVRYLSDPQVLHLLRQLSEDPDVGVANAALLAWLGQQPKEPEVRQKTVARLLAEAFERQEGVSALRQLRYSGTLPPEALSALRRVSHPAWRAEVWLLMLEHEPPSRALELGYEALQDDSTEVRQVGLRVLENFRETLSEEQLLALAMSPHLEVRETLLDWLPRMPKETAHLLARELLLDPEAKFRAAALQHIVAAQGEGWQEYLKAAWLDESLEVNRTAVNLVHRLPEDDRRVLCEAMLQLNERHPMAPALRGWLRAN